MYEAELAKYGIGGLAVLLLGFCAYIFKAYSKIASNHIAHSTQAMDKMSSSIDRLDSTLKDFKEELRNKK